MIEVQNLTRKFGDTIAVNQVTFSIPAGQICGYLGPNGAGKTTTVKMLTGMIQPSSGTAKINGYDVVNNPLEVKRCIGYVPESGALYQSLSPFEYLLFIGRLYGMDDEQIEKRIDEFARFFQFHDGIHRQMTEFSKGTKQKVVISAALIHSPQVIFLDEPLSGLDANAALLLKKLLQQLSREGRTIFYCSHILEVVEVLCDRILIIDKGQLVADGSIDKLKEMTRQSSLEEVFRKLTRAGDVEEEVNAFSKTLMDT